MVSIPGREGLDITYRDSPSTSLETPTSPSSWEETLQMLSRELQVICRSPDSHENLPPFPCLQKTSPGPASPTGGELINRADAKLLTVRHLQSEEKLEEKLTYICRSPRRSTRPTGSKTAKIVRPSKRKSNYGLPYFRTTVAIGEHGIEDIHVYIEDHKLKVLHKSDACDDSEECELPTSIEIPAHVNPAKLICIVKDEILEVKESKHQGRSRHTFVNGLDLRRSLSAGGLRWHTNSDQSPIVIEDEGSHQLKLVLQVPKGFNFDDLKIKTIDDHLIISGKRCQALCESCDLALSNFQKCYFDEKDEMFQVFELPSSVDPYSITAHLTDQMQLIIQAELSPRSRSNTL